MKTTSVLAMFAALIAVVAGLAYFGGTPASPPSLATPAAAPDPAMPDGQPAPAVDDGPDFHLTNPFELDAKADQKPVAEAATVEHSFGAMAPNEELSHKFIVKNTGTAPLKLAKGRYQCKCTMPTMKKGEVREVKPGEEADIEMTWKPLAPEEMFLKTVEIWTNDPDHPKLTFSVQGQVVPHIMAEPSSFSMGPIRNEEGATFSGFLISKTDDFEIVETSSDNPAITVTTEVVTGDAIPSDFKEAKQLIRINGIVAPSDKVGPVNATVTLKTNLEAHKEVTVAVNGRMTGPLTVLGTGWDQVYSSFDLGRVECAKGKSVKFSVFIPPIGEELALKSVEAKPNVARMTLKKDPSFTAPDRERYELIVELRPGCPKGEFSNGNPIVVNVTTNHPKISEIPFKILYRGF